MNATVRGDKRVCSFCWANSGGVTLVGSRKSIEVCVKCFNSLKETINNVGPIERVRVKPLET